MNQGNTPKETWKDGRRCSAASYTTGSYRRAIHRICDKHDLEKWSPNRIRHTAATEIRQKFGLEATQTVLGHSNAVVTEISAERDLALAAAIAAQLG
ncbi:tyrosine-type recombinase/integrase [Aeoliella mucimassa]|uniref:Tyr recombinase domain-containing protein n=1 Tax=Aeoliella mucimassa TaxID=2527972 RepID=A0A518APN5_9BACT|nr:tyrosine-type recombinase/integrase [Aeoliella mucimassa]QDU56690.1 hypothetical protein Pan181_29000 [Aeoliella mucimassa]